MIGIFDSGLGGVPIWQAIVALLPDEEYTYVADQAYLPYGVKTDNEITNRARSISKYLIEKGASLVVVACNTATVSSIKALRKEFPATTFVGVEPALKPASILNKKTLVLGTKSTLASAKFRELLKKNGIGSISLLSLPDWVDRAENGMKLELSKKQEKEITDADVVVLACTHYIYFMDELQTMFPSKIFIEPSLAVANRVKALYKAVGVKGRKTILTTGAKSQLKPIEKHLHGWGVKLESVKI